MNSKNGVQQSNRQNLTSMMIYVSESGVRQDFSVEVQDFIKNYVEISICLRKEK